MVMLIITTTLTVAVHADEKKHPGFWIKYESLVSDSACFRSKDGHALFCPYDAQAWRRKTTLITEDLPNADERIPVVADQMKVSER